MDQAPTVALVERLLPLGLAIRSKLTDVGYVVEVTGGKKSATGVAETFHRALARLVALDTQLARVLSYWADCHASACLTRVHHI